MKLRWLLLLGLIACLAAGAWWIFRQPVLQGAQTVQLQNGAVITFTDVSHGTNHVTGPFISRIVSKMPGFIQIMMQRLTGLTSSQMRNTHRPVLGLWYESQKQIVVSPPKAYLADDNGYISGDEVHHLITFSTGPSMAEFNVFPRRSRTFSLHIVESDSTGKYLATTVVSNLLNPVYQKFPEWTPEPLPCTKTVDNLSVTLHAFGTGLDTYRGSTWANGRETMQFKRKRQNGNNYSAFTISFAENSRTNAPWTVAETFLADATGNEISSNSRSGSGSGVYLITPSLWPNESAWKLKLVMKRAAEFATNELFTFKDIPVGNLNETNMLNLTTNIGGAQIIFSHFVLRPGPTNQNSWSSYDFSELQIRSQGLSDGQYFDLLEAKAGEEKLEIPSRGSSGKEQTFYFRKIPTAAQTIDLTFALHRSRTVEFLVKPVLENPAFPIHESSD